MVIKRQINFTEWPKPIFSEVVRTNKHFRSNFQSAMMFAHYELSAADLKKEVTKWLKGIDNKNPLLDRIKDVNENRFSGIGKYAYILNHNGDIPVDISIGLLPALEKILLDEELKESERLKDLKFSKIETPKVVISIQDRIKEKSREVAGEIEGWIDDFYLSRKVVSPKTIEEFSNLFKLFELKSPHLRYVHGIFERRATEIAKVVEGKDKDLVEGYSNFTKAELKKFDIFYQNLLKSCELAQEVAKVERAPRKKKPISQDKLVSKFKYKKEDQTLGIVSLNPVNIIGAKEVWTYNTKTRKLAQYKSADIRGLTVKGASIENFSADSVEKTLRKHIETLADFKKASKVKLRTFLKDLGTVDTPVTGKLNEHHVILRIDK